MLKKCRASHNLYNNEEGFILLEAVISIAVLALVSGFIIQMFLVSSNVNARAREIDSGNAAAIMAVELFKKQSAAEDYAREDFFADCGLRQSEGGFTIYKWYDNSFAQVAAAPAGAGDPENPPGEASFLLQVETERGEERPAGAVPGEEAPPAGRLDTVRAVVLKLEDGGGKELARIEADKYFTYAFR